RGVGQRQMNGFAVAIRRDAAIDVRETKYIVDRTEHVLARTERVIEPHKAPRNVAGEEDLLEMTTRGVIFARCCALEREDRLLFVAHGENRTPDMSTRPCAGAEFRYQPLDDVPLLFAGVLRFVDQYVIEPEIELVVHPVRIAFGQQMMGLLDQIIVIEKTAAILLVAVAPDHPNRYVNQRSGAVAAHDTVAARDKSDHPVLLGTEPL